MCVYVSRSYIEGTTVAGEHFCFVYSRTTGLYDLWPALSICVLIHKYLYTNKSGPKDDFKRRVDNPRASS